MAWDEYLDLEKGEKLTNYLVDTIQQIDYQELGW
jgi:hypothetical protein